ncbi:hybrid sensor histidine kinase/response regulator [Pseudohongiella spirulinae]|uniref:histidine kinase n=1 Tax=Pseudohongiella spirulinae TaxID=1249552 RepID=A0A0S2KFF0_9GAMM|nr:PAS domain-containing hybrid sensor histidine kinase/response regulator [Pseudohongiella spirulinae]ALO46835.1 Na+/proline symporter [Pseudohongiella spirulinae]
MLSIPLVLCAAFIYLTLLFGIASYGERRSAQGIRPWRYTLALGVHCTTWAFYGTVTQAAQYGWWFAPTYLGGICIFLFAHQFQIKMLKLVKQQNLTSIADLIGSRYGKSPMLAAVVALICLVALIPYIALQLRAVAASFAAVTGMGPALAPWFMDLAAAVALAMIGFAILFGARRLSLAEQHSGLMDAVAFESVVKLTAFAIVGMFVSYQLFDGINDLVVQTAADPIARTMLQPKENGVYIYLTHMLLGALAMFVLPRQFQVNFIENNSPEELKKARWAFPLYLFAINFFILPIAMGGMLLAPEAQSQDTFLLSLPILADRPDISLVAFIGGLSTATSMVIMATLALSIMISNDVITPLWLRSRRPGKLISNLMPGDILLTRRLTMLLIVVLAYIYHKLTQGGVPLVSNGLIAMALVSQLAPAMFGGLLWARANLGGAIAGLLSGTGVWTFTLLLPSINPAVILSDKAISDGVVISLAVNIAIYVVVSLVTRQSALEQNQARHFTRPDRESALPNDSQQVTWGKLRAVLSRFVNPADASGLDRRLGLTIADEPDEKLVHPTLLARMERELAGAIGSSASRLLISSLARTSADAVDEVVDWASEASQLYRFNRELLQASVENIPQGISVIDKELRLVAWNQRYLEIFDYPDGLIKAGVAIEEILNFNARRGLFGAPDANIEEEVSKRLEHLRSGSRYRYQRQQPSGQIIELQGNPMPDGGFVTTYTDITELVIAQDELRRINAELEARVAERTQALSEAKQAAEFAHQSKSRFFAAASHDLMQPFNAASLFCEMLLQRLQHDESRLALQIQQSLQNAEELLTMLLEMTKLESGNLQPIKNDVALWDIMQPLQASFQLLAQDKGLDFRMHPSQAVVYTDQKILQRILQNLLSNAIRYTPHGRVVCGVRRRTDMQLELQVWDTGRGIPHEKFQEIFMEFKQLDQQDHNPGLGLGLAIVDRMCKLLEIPLRLESTLGRGTCFALTLPVRNWQSTTLKRRRSAYDAARWSVPDNTHVLILDDDDNIRDALTSLFQGWGAKVTACATLQDALQLEKEPDLLFIDYHLSDHDVGTEAITELRHRYRSDIPAILSTADPDENIREQVVQVKAMFLPKPVKQAALKRLLKSVLSW